LTVISGFVQILLFQGLGELVTHFVLPLIPGPVIGLVLLLAWLVVRRTVPAAIIVYERSKRHPLANPVAIAVILVAVADRDGYR
jgi:holin-like protein